MTNAYTEQETSAAMASAAAIVARFGRTQRAVYVASDRLTAEQAEYAHTASVVERMQSLEASCEAARIDWGCLVQSMDVRIRRATLVARFVEETVDGMDSICTQGLT